MNIIKQKTKNSSHSTLCIGYKEKYIEDTMNTEFLGLPIDNHIYWKNYTEQIIPKLSGECYAIRSMVNICNINILKSIYYAYFHSKLWLVHNPEPHAEIYLNNYRFYLFHASIYFHYWTSLSIMWNFLNKFIYTQYNKHYLHRPNANLPYFKKSTFYAGIKIFNCLPPSVTILKNGKAKFKVALRRYLYTHSFYSVDEFFMCKDEL
jgi:hypothetical protein